MATPSSSRRENARPDPRGGLSRSDRRKRALAWFIVVLMLGSAFVSLIYYLQPAA